MALVLADRVKETTTTTGTGTYTLAGAVTGFESFATIGNSNTTYYCCTDGTDFEVGIGTYTASGTTLARTTILQSSNSDAAVNWSAGTRSIFCTQPAEKAVFLDGSGDVTLGNDLSIGGNLTSVGDITVGANSTPSITFQPTGDTQQARLFFKNTAGTTESIFRYAYTENQLQYYDSVNNFEVFHFGSDGQHQIVGDVVTITSTDAGASNLPTLTLKRDSSSPADFDGLGNILFVGKNDADQDVTYAEFEGIITDASDGTEDGFARVKLMIGGTLTNQFDFANYANVSYKNLLLTAGNNLLFEGSTDDTNETTLTVTDPTADRTITLPDATGQVVLKDSSDTVTISSTANDGPILDLVSDDPADAADYSVEGKIRFTAENSASESIEYASMRLRTADVTDGTEDGSIYFAFTQQGTNADKFAMLSGAFFLLDDNGYIEWNQTKGTSFDVILDTATPTADRRVTLPDATGTVLTTGNSDTPTTTTTAADADFVLVDDGGTMKKITPANLGITAGAASVDDATALAIALG